MNATRAANTGGEQTKNNSVIPKLPAYGKALADRMRWNHKPFLVIICTGGDCWQRAKNWQRHSDFSALVLTPEHDPNALNWAVAGCVCLIEWAAGPPEILIYELVKTLLKAGAVLAAVMPMWVDHDSPSQHFDTTTQAFVQSRECLRIYRPRGCDVTF